MDFARLRLAALLWACIACGGERRAATVPQDPDALTLVEQARLEQAPYLELAFVPADAEALVRVDLGALLAAEERAARMLEFLLRAQQPAVHEFLGAAGVRPGQELAALYLIVGPRARQEGAFLLAAVGRFETRRILDALARTGGRSERAAGDGHVHVWTDGDDARVGAHEPPPRHEVGEAAMGVGEGLLLFGPPHLVRRALAVRAGEGKDVRRSALGKELLTLDFGSVAWGVARGDGTHAWAAELAPGLVKARFVARRGAAIPAAGDATHAVELHAEFRSPGEAEAFRRALGTWLETAAAMSSATQVGGAALRLKEGLRVAVEEKRGRAGHRVVVARSTL
jgi:hypothetical protein